MLVGEVKSGNWYSKSSGEETAYIEGPCLLKGDLFL